MLIVALSTIATTLKEPNGPTRRLGEDVVVYIHNGELYSSKKNQNHATCLDMDRTSGYHAE